MLNMIYSLSYIQFRIVCIGFKLKTLLLFLSWRSAEEQTQPGSKLEVAAAAGDAEQAQHGGGCYG